MANESVNRFFGGSPAAVILRLILLSLVVGVILSALNLTPTDVFRRLSSFVQYLYDMGFVWIEWLIGYVLIGAVIVVPIWLVIRLLKYSRNRI